MSGTVRQQKFAKLIQKEMSDIFHRDRRGILENEFITITDVRMSPDLSVAKIYLSMMLVKDRQGVLDRINLRKSEIRKALGDKIRKQARIIPQLAFFIDDVEEKAIKMDALIDSLKIPPAPPEGNKKEK
jgi:ribosome-binding factor A